MSDKDHTDKDIQIDYEILRQFEEYFDPQIENDDEDRMCIEGIENLTPKEELRVLNNYDEENTLDGDIHTLAIELEQLRRFGEIIYKMPDGELKYDKKLKHNNSKKERITEE